MTPARGRALVRAVETDERLGSLIIPQTARERELTRNQYEVIAVGEPEVCDDPDDCQRWAHADDTHPIDPRIVPGAWVLVEQGSLVDASHPTERQYYVGFSNIAAVFTEESP